MGLAHCFFCKMAILFHLLFSGTGFGTSCRRQAFRGTFRATAFALGRLPLQLVMAFLTTSSKHWVVGLVLPISGTSGHVQTCWLYFLPDCLSCSEPAMQLTSASVCLGTLAESCYSLGPGSDTGALTCSSIGLRIVGTLASTVSKWQGILQLVSQVGGFPPVLCPWCLGMIWGFRGSSLPCSRSLLFPSTLERWRVSFGWFQLAGSPWKPPCSASYLGGGGGPPTFLLAMSLNVAKCNFGKVNLESMRPVVFLTNMHAGWLQGFALPHADESAIFATCSCFAIIA